MRQFVLPFDYDGEKTIHLTGKEYHRICRVLRLKTNDSFPGRDAFGKPYTLTILSINNDSCLAKVEMKDDVEREAPDLTLFQCLIKGRKFDEVIKKATEVGIGRIIPVLSDYTVVKLSSQEKKGRKLDRWKHIAREAMQQSGAPRLPEIGQVSSFKEIPRIWKSAGAEQIGLFFHQTPLENSSLHSLLSPGQTRIALVIGPEGGFSDGETRFLSDHGFHPVYLGEQILRSETAAVYAAACVKTILMEMSHWKTR